MQFQTIKVISNGERLDTFLAKKLKLSRSSIQRLIESDNIHLNNKTLKKTGLKLHEGDRVSYRIPEAKDSKHLAQDIPLEIIHEDKNILVINKQAGIVVHPDDSGHDHGTIVNAVLSHCSKLSGIGGEKRPGIIHRLDKDTSGVLLIAKNDKTHQKLAAEFHDRKVDKTYIALVKGTPKSKTGRIEASLKRDSKHRKQMAISSRGKNAISTFEVIETFPKASLLKVKIETGRTHQIRVHLASIGHPVIGDKVYGDKITNKKYTIKRQFLHAKELTILKKTYKAPLSKDLKTQLKELRS